MCLVSYISMDDGSFVLTSNRDESPQRAAVSIETMEARSRKVWYPKDTMGGSWYFVSSHGEVVCLLNGAFQIHKRVLPYKMSRGKMLKAFFDYDGAGDFLYRFDFHNIEPFTMVIGRPGSLKEFRWDGSVKHVLNLDTSRSHVWSSCTLYTEESQQKRASLFNELLHQHPSPRMTDVENIHRTSNALPETDAFIMNRENIVRTISITQTMIGPEQITFKYADLLDSNNGYFAQLK